jgi:intein/homing endonuclease
MFKGDIAKIIVGDSRFGWMKALDRFFEILTQKHYEHVSTIVINYNSIRPKGERLKTFGGFASGHEPLMNMFTKVMKTIKQHDAVWTKLRTIDVMDIANIIGENVVSGGVRRTSEVTLFDIDDKDVYTAKSGMYEQIDGEWKENKEILHRRMSNNSIFFQKPPTKEQIAKAITEARYSGEPGMIFGYNGRKRRENFDVVNPCVEILLADRGNCNLTTVNVMAFVKDGKFDFEMFARAQYLSGRASYRMTNVELELHKWNLVHKRDRLTGTSLTGIQDMFNATGMDHEQQIRFFKIAREAAINGANSVADEQGTPRSLLTTTIKPEGCWTGEYTRTLDQGIVFLDEIDKDIFDRPQGFSDLKENLTFEGNEVTKTYVNDVKDILKIKLKSGRELKITPSHPLMVNGEWVQAKDLKIGDKIDSKEVAYEGKVNSFLDDRLDLTNFRADVRDYAVPFEMNEDLAYLLGAYFANGSFTTNDRIKYHAQYLEQHLKIQKIWKKLFGVETKIVKSTDRDSYTQDFRSTKIRLWLDKNGLADKESNRIPLAIRTSSREAILSFFVGYADNDGHFAAKSFSIDTAKEEWARHLQEVGEAVGLVFGLSINKARDNSFSGKPMYKLYLQRSFSAKDIFEYVNNHSIKAAMQGLIQSGAVRSKHPHTIVGIEELEQQATYDIEVENVHMYAQGALISHNTMTQLPTVSSGIHFNHSEYYIRRVRINSGDPLVKAIKEIGWEIKPEVGQEIETADTVVVEFPVKSPAGKTKFDVGAIEQLELYKMSMEHYTQHNTSITVHVRDHEWDDVIDWIDENKDWMIAVSFLSLDDSYYQLMPYEAIDEETYNKMEAQMKPFKPSLLSKYETGQDFDLGDAECATGSCPIR